MQFTSFAFLLFAALTLLAYFLLPKRVQWVVLLASSLLFYAMSGVEYLFFILYTAAVTYLTSRALQSRADREDACVEANRDTWSKQERKAYRAEEKKKRFRVLLCGLLLGFGMLAVIKYTAFVLGNINGIVTALGGKGMEIPSLLLPLGISFYTFQSMGYLIDVYRKTVRAEQNPAKLLLFVSFFPQLLQGPISRFGDLQKQLTAPHAFDGFAFRSGALRVAWGFFKKLIVADTAMMGIKTLIERSGEFQGFYVALLILLYSAQIYGDFTGGIDITIGLSEMMGIKLSENFNRPFSSRSTKEYWNRWHITMGTWFTDYVFYPLSVSRPLQKLSSSAVARFGKGFGMRLPVYAATIVTWFLTGLWHGAGWNFIVWGLLNCLVILVSRELEPLYRKFNACFPRLTASKGWGAWQAIRTFLLMGLIRSLDCYRDVPLTFRLWASMLTRWNWGELFTGGLTSFGLGVAQWCVILVGVAVIFAVSRLGKDVPLRHRIAGVPVLWCACVCVMIVFILVFGAYGIGFDASQFIYQQF
ncbi:MAG: MBOAT family protein [Clostridia bacterium]|nr:MBOAT family protein [Clostridia bacterium]